MIYIIRDTPTTVCVSLTQSSQITDAFFLFEIKSNSNDDFETVYVSYPDTSVNKERYNQFEFELDIPKGEYTYNVYESTTADPEEISDTTEVVIETGLLICDSDDVTEDSVYI